MARKGRGLDDKKIATSGYCRVRVNYFQRGRQRHYFVEYMDGIPVLEWYHRNADPITKLIDGEYESLHADGF